MPGLAQTVDLVAMMDTREERMIRNNPDSFEPDFLFWLRENHAIWTRFSANASVVAQHRSHYSARTIVEYLRHETALRDVTSKFKLDDHRTPSLARLWLLMHPEHPRFFDTKVIAGSSKRAA